MLRRLIKTGINNLVEYSQHGPWQVFPFCFSVRRLPDQYAYKSYLPTAKKPTDVVDAASLILLLHFCTQLRGWAFPRSSFGGVISENVDQGFAVSRFL